MQSRRNRTYLLVREREAQGTEDASRLTTLTMLLLQIDPNRQQEGGGRRKKVKKKNVEKETVFNMFFTKHGLNKTLLTNTVIQKKKKRAEPH